MSDESTPLVLIVPVAKSARLTLRAGIWYAGERPCSGWKDALTRTLQAARIPVAKPPKIPKPPKRAKPTRAEPEARQPDPLACRIVRAAGYFYFEGRPYATWGEAMARARTAEKRRHARVMGVGA